MRAESRREDEGRQGHDASAPVRRWCHDADQWWRVEANRKGVRGESRRWNRDNIHGRPVERLGPVLASFCLRLNSDRSPNGSSKIYCSLLPATFDELLRDQQNKKAWQ